MCLLYHPYRSPKRQAWFASMSSAFAAAGYAWCFTLSLC